MKKSTLVIIIVVLVALGIGGLFALSGDDNKPETEQETTATTQQTTDDTTTPQSTETPSGDAGTGDQAATDEVEIEDFAFKPNGITIKKGTTVTWANRDEVQHSVVPDSGDSDAFRGSQLLSRDETYSFTFNTPGTYTYHCGPHPSMTGTVTVTE